VGLYDFCYISEKRKGEKRIFSGKAENGTQFSESVREASETDEFLLMKNIKIEKLKF
jgi:hypothetical protein